MGILSTIKTQYSGLTGPLKPVPPTINSATRAAGFPAPVAPNMSVAPRPAAPPAPAKPAQPNYGLAGAMGSFLEKGSGLFGEMGKVGQWFGDKVIAPVAQAATGAIFGPGAQAAVTPPPTSPAIAAAPGQAPAASTLEQLRAANQAKRAAAPVVPNVPAGHVVTPSGAIVNPTTGGYKMTAAPATPNPNIAPGLPGGPDPAQAGIGNQSILNDNTTPPPTNPPPTPPPTPTPTPAPVVPDTTQAEKDYAASLQMTPEEEAAQAEIDRIQEGTTLGKNKIRDQAIPMDFITGQEASLERRSLALQEPLDKKLARLQAKRMAAMGATKFTLDRADAAKKAATEQANADRTYNLEAQKAKSGDRTTLGAGQTAGHYDASGKFIADYTAPSAAKDDGTHVLSPGQRVVDAKGNLIAENPASSAADKTISVAPGNTVIDQAGNVIYTAPAKGGQDAAQNVKEIDQTLGLVDEILNNPALSQITGIPNVFTAWTPGTAAQYAKAQVKQLKSFLALENRQKLKGQGTISDREFAVLTAASTALDAGLSDADTIKELQKVRATLEQRKTDLLSGAAGTAGGSDQEWTAPDGTIYQLGPDGTYYPKAKGGPTASTTGPAVTKALTSIPTDVKWGEGKRKTAVGQCGALVNDVTGLRVGDSLASKAAACDPRIKPATVAVGDVFVQRVSNDPQRHGHTGIINRVGTDKGGRRFAIVTEANYHLNGQTTHDRKIYLDDPHIVGFAKPKRINPIA